MELHSNRNSWFLNTCGKNSLCYFHFQMENSFYDSGHINKVTQRVGCESQKQFNVCGSPNLGKQVKKLSSRYKMPC